MMGTIEDDETDEEFEDWKISEMNRLREGRDAWRFLALVFLMGYVALFGAVWGAGR